MSNIAPRKARRNFVFANPLQDVLPAVDPTDPLPDPILDALSELHWDERLNDPAESALRP